MYSKIINPKTGRKVNVSGKLGRSIIRNYLTILNAGGKTPKSQWGPAKSHRSDMARRDLAGLGSADDYLPAKHKHYTTQLNELGMINLEDFSPWRKGDYEETLATLVEELGAPPGDIKEIIHHAWTMWFNTAPHASERIGRIPDILGELHLAGVISTKQLEAWPMPIVK